MCASVLAATTVYCVFMFTYLCGGYEFFQFPEIIHPYCRVQRKLLTDVLADASPRHLPLHRGSQCNISRQRTVKAMRFEML